MAGIADLENRGIDGTRRRVVSEDSFAAVDRAVLREKGGTFPVYVDVGHGAQRAFANFGTPAFYVLDAGGAVRFEWAQPSDVPRDLSVVAPTQRSELR